MKKYIFLFALVAGSVTLFTSCDPSTCNSCDDPELVKVPASSSVAPDHQWEISTAVFHSNGTASSSISIIPEGTSSVTASRADSVKTTVYITAKDTLSGIKCVELFGGFGFTCSQGAGGPSVIIDGILPRQTECNPLTTCCLKSDRLKLEDVSQYIRCPSGVFVNGTMGITAIITNCNNVKDTTFLNVNF